MILVGFGARRYVILAGFDADIYIYIYIYGIVVVAAVVVFFQILT